MWLLCDCNNYCIIISYLYTEHNCNFAWHYHLFFFSVYISFFFFSFFFLQYGRGRASTTWRRRKWVFGMLGVKHNLRRPILRLVTRRSRNHLIPIIVKHVRYNPDLRWVESLQRCAGKYGLQTFYSQSQSLVCRLKHWSPFTASRTSMAVL